jgi:hypothetical protein
MPFAFSPTRCIARIRNRLSVHLARPEGGAAPSLMLEYQKSRRRRTALGPGDSGGVRCVEKAKT